jgi:putative Mg2+ transporter-C (MgtC) family protein
MPTSLTWYAIALRLALTVLAAGVIGFDRDERGRSAGLRTNLLVALAACIAMIQTNLLIDSHGKSADSFVVMDIMRLPLGILSGIGFIGAGAIIKRGELIMGVTTAATLWFVTVMGLCFGGGQIGLGIASFVLGFGILSGLKKLEGGLQREHSGLLKVTVSANGPNPEEVAAQLVRAGISLANPSFSRERAPSEDRVFGWKLKWKGERKEDTPPRVIQDLASRPDIERLEFTP